MSSSPLSFVRPPPRDRETYFGVETAETLAIETEMNRYLDTFSEERTAESKRFKPSGGGERLNGTIGTLRGTLRDLSRLLGHSLDRSRHGDLIAAFTELITQSFIAGTIVGSELGEHVAKKPLKAGGKLGAERGVAERRRRREEGSEAIALNLANSALRRDNGLSRTDLASEIISLWTSEEVRCVKHETLMRFLKREEGGRLPARARARPQVTEPPSMH